MTLRSNRGITVLLACVCLATLAVSPRAAAQYTTAVGTPTFTTALPVEMGFTNVSNGNLHIEIPLASFPQRGTLTYNARLVVGHRCLVAHNVIRRFV